MLKVYVASPLGFTEPGRMYNKLLVSKLTEAGFEVLDPWSIPEGELIAKAKGLPHGEARCNALWKANQRVGGANEQAIRSADAMLAVLDGYDVDSGTSAEIGYMACRGRSVVGLRTDWRTGGEEGSPVNVQVAYWIDWFTDSIEGAIEQLRAIEGVTQMYDEIPEGEHGVGR